MKKKEKMVTVSLADLCLKHRKAGIKEVVDYTAREFGIDWSQEKAQLKEWGVK